MNSHTSEKMFINHKIHKIVIKTTIQIKNCIFWYFLNSPSQENPDIIFSKTGMRITKYNTYKKLVVCTSGYVLCK